jgi:hypothetical protein
MRDTLLDLAGQGLLPDRVLSQALDLLGRPAERWQPADKRRELLLEQLLQNRRVGEFIDSWQQADTPPGGMPPASRETETQQPASLEALPQTEWRTQAEFFGLPLVHCVRGKDPRTGKRRVAKGIVALGEVAVGVIACGGVALGGVAVGGVSVGLLAAGGVAVALMMSAGAVAVGPSAFGAVTFAPDGGLFPTLLRVLLAIVLLRLLIRWRRFRKRYGSGDDGGAVSVWSILSGREWRSDGTPFRGGNIVATLGACDIDLSETTLAGPEAAIEATAIGGAIKIIVPVGWRIVTQGTQLLGGYANKTRPPHSGFTGSAPRLLVKGFVLCGAVEVTHPLP